MGETDRLFQEIHNSDGTFRTSFDWLGSDWPERRWRILDAGNPDLKPASIRFDVPALPRKTFLDLPEILTDIKKIIAATVELKDFRLAVSCNSSSSIRRFGHSVLRIYREVFDMGLRDISDITDDTIFDLRDRLLHPEHISRSYPLKMMQIIDELGINNLPVRIDRSKKHVSGIDRKQFNLLAGMADYRTCSECKQIFNDLARALADEHPEYNWEPPKTYSPSSYVSEKQAKDQAAVLSVIYDQSQLLNDLSAPLKVNPFPDLLPSVFVDQSFRQQKLTTRPSRGRTRNLPVPSFLKLMDSAVRWVIDYADPLVDLEEVLNTEVAYLSESLKDDYVRRIINGRVRERSTASEWAWKPASPFPLASYRHHRSTPGSKYDEETISVIDNLTRGGMSATDCAEHLGLTKRIVEAIQARYIRDIHSHNLETTGVSLNYALYGYLPFCCAVILLAFTAGRESSIADLRAGCIRRFGGLLYINLYVPKTLRRYEDLPTVALVEKAVNVLERLSADARAKTGSDRLFQFDDIVADRTKGLRFDNVYPNFFDHIGMPKDDEGNHWQLGEHQFRRFFAIMFFYRYGSENEASFESLMYQLRHEDWTMTDIYLTEREQGRIFREVEEEWLSQVLAAGQPQDESLQDLRKDSQDVQNSVYNNTKLLRPQDSEKALKRVQEEGLTLEFLSFGAICLGLSPGRGKLAKCATEVQGDYVACLHKASEALCKGCKNLVEAPFIYSHKRLESNSLTHLECSSPILDAVIATDGGSDG